MNSREILARSNKYEVDPRIAARATETQLAKWKKKADLPVEIQWQILQDKKWGNLLKKSPSWSLKSAFKAIGFRKVKPPEKAAWEKFVSTESRVIALALVLEMSCEEAEKFPGWVTLKEVEQDRRLLANEWLRVSKVRESQYRSMTNMDVDFMIHVHGYAFPWENQEEALEIVQKFAPEEWAKAFSLWRMLGQVPTSLKPWGDGFEAFSDRVVAAVVKTPFLEELRGKVPEEACMLEEHLEQIYFETLDDFPEELLQGGRQDGTISSETLGKEKWEILETFRLLEKPMEEWKAELGEEAEKFLRYWYPWRKKDIKYYDLIKQTDLHSPIEENGEKVLQHLGLWWEENVKPVTVGKILDLWEKGILEDVCQGIRGAEWDTSQELKKAFQKFLNGEELGFPGSHTGDFAEAFKQAKELGKQYDGKWLELWLSLLNGNRWVEKGRVFYETLAQRQGVWGRYVFEDGTVPDCKCIWGLSEFRQIIKVGQEIRQFDKLVIE